jgi:alkylhydroperoxidase family enzyme
MESDRQSETTAPPRIVPGSRAENGALNTAIAWLLGVATGGTPPHVFTTLARHRRMFRRWLAFAGTLMPGGLLARELSELVILRVAHNCGSVYEWRQHARLGRLAGLSAEEIERVSSGPDAVGWSPAQAVLLAAADELHADRTISDALWSELATRFSEPELIEICMLVGHYEMLAMTLNALRVAPDEVPSGRPSTVLRLLHAASTRRTRKARTA